MKRPVSYMIKARKHLVQFQNNAPPYEPHAYLYTSSPLYHMQMPVISYVLKKWGRTCCESACNRYPPD
eukprot:4874014-Amphidinium_carterae.1